jgi:ribosomal protein S18 acetylase RimI-like enzyme
MAHVWVAGPEDAGAVARLLAGFRDFWNADEPSEAAFREVVERLIPDPGTEFLLAAPAEGRPAAGFAQVRYRLSVWEGADDCWLEDLFVDGEARGMGLGEALVAVVAERARARGCRRIELDVNEANTGARRFYARAGFTEEPKPPGRTLFVSRRL